MLVERLRALDPDPRNWKYPPATEEDVEYAKKYLRLALALFSNRVQAAEFLKKIQEIHPGLAPDII
ncbi:MAG: hypothetical protein V1806_00550 [Pseudomonadota bacterium]